MNSYERIKTALELKEPDRVPIIEFLVNPNVAKAACPEAEDSEDFAEIAGLDAVCCPGSLQFKKVSESDGTYVDEWGVTYRKGGAEAISHPVRGPIQTVDDLDSYVPPDPDAPHLMGNLPELVRRFKGQKAIIFAHRAAFMWSVFLNGMENLMMNFLTQPDFVHALLDMVLAVNEKIVRNAVRAGADIIIAGDDYASNRAPLMSPDIFRQFVFPRLKKFVDAVHEEGAYMMKHTDGNIWSILDMIVDAGIDAINPMEPVAGMDIGEVKQKYGDRVCLVGNIDCGDLLSNGTTGEVESAVKECIRKASGGGGHIICSSNSIHSSVKPENYLAMIKATKEFGKYPINLGGIGSKPQV